MTEKPRRRFLKHSASLVSSLAAASCVTPGMDSSERSSGSAVGGALDRDTLLALAKLVLPSDSLGDDGVSVAVDDFIGWLDGFEPVAELDHHYLWTDDISYGPGDPAPLFASQLEALTLEAKRRHEQPFHAIDVEAQQQIFRNQLPAVASEGLPFAGEAPHVAIGLLSHFYATSEALDLCYGRKIEKQTCRGLDSAADEPQEVG